jgi:hypothetical protein
LTCSKSELIKIELLEINSDLGIHIFIKNDTLRAKSSFAKNSIPLLNIQKNKFQRLNNASIIYQFNIKKKHIWI